MMKWNSVAVLAVHDTAFSSRCSRIRGVLSRFATLLSDLLHAFLVEWFGFGLFCLFVGLFTGASVVVLLVALTGQTTLFTALGLYAFDARTVLGMVVSRVHRTRYVVL